MTGYRRWRVPGGTFVFTVNLAKRRGRAFLNGGAPVESAAKSSACRKLLPCVPPPAQRQLRR